MAPWTWSTYNLQITWQAKDKRQLSCSKRINSISFTKWLFYCQLRPTLKTLKVFTVSKVLKSVTGCTYQCLEQLEAETHTKSPEPLIVWGNQLTTSAVNSTWHTKHVENQFRITWHSLMQLINNFEKKIVKSPGEELSSAFRKQR